MNTNIKPLPDFTDRDITRFWKLVARGEGCWIWQGHTRGLGYGRFQIRSSYYQAHRCMWLLSRNTDPGAMHVLHRCDNPPCVRPDHLFLGTAKDNMEDAINKGRVIPGARSLAARATKKWNSGEGECNPAAILTVEQVVEARRRYANGESIRRMYREFGVSRSALQYAINGTTWAHIPGAGA